MAEQAEFQTIHTAFALQAMAPDGSEVRILSRTARGSMALFTLPPGAVAKAVMHRTVDELWYVAEEAVFVPGTWP
jgi:mannose-6-phosphate isomerase-like protein (cupin superfamily)